LIAMVLSLEIMFAIVALNCMIVSETNSVNGMRTSIYGQFIRPLLRADITSRGRERVTGKG